MAPQKRNKPKPKFYLWPDADGLLILPDPPAKLSTASKLMRSRSLPRIAKKVPFGSEWVHIQNSRIRMMNGAAVGFKIAIESIFVAWLTAALFEAAYNCLTLRRVITSAELELGLNVEAIMRLIIRHTSDRGEFQSDGELVTFRD